MILTGIVIFYLMSSESPNAPAESPNAPAGTSGSFKKNKMKKNIDSFNSLDKRPFIHKSKPLDFKGPGEGDEELPLEEDDR